MTAPQNIAILAIVLIVLVWCLVVTDSKTKPKDHVAPNPGPQMAEVQNEEDEA